jgi:hypothetical protein
MADYMSAHIVIGGKLSENKLDEFCSLILELHADFFDGALADKDYVRLCSEQKKSMFLADFQARYGEFEVLKKFCMDNNLCFKRQGSPKDEYEGEIRFFSPDTGDFRFGATDNGDPYLKLSELETYKKKGLTLQEVIDTIKRCYSIVSAFELTENPLDLIELIANSYYWTCPKCDNANEEIRTNDFVNCRKCKKRYQVVKYFCMQ